VEEVECTDLQAEMGPGAADICQVVPEVRDRLPALPAAAPLEPTEARFRLFDSITRFLENSARRQPLVIVVDDLHWADKPSLVLLQFIAREIARAPLLLVGSYRDGAVGRQHPLFQTLGELAREPACRRLVLSGLSEGEVGLFVELATGRRPPAGLVSTVANATEGNPFFVGEVVRLLASEGRLEQYAEGDSWSVRLPEGVREAVGRRLDHLSTDCHRILTLASVAGRTFRLEALARLSGLSRDRLLDLLEEAKATRLVSEVPRAFGYYRFSHALIRETLHEDVPTARRVALHRRIGEVLEELYAAKLEPHVAELAYHFFEAARGGGDVEKAIAYAQRAGMRATTLLAYEDAASHYERALAALEAKDPDDSTQRCELLLAVGEAQNNSGDRDRARETFLKAAAVARRLGASDRLAQAALGLGPGFLGFEFGILEDALVGLLEEALETVPEGDSLLRSRVLGSLAMALYWSPARERSVTLSEKAVETARRVGDPATLAAALHSARWALWGSEGPERRLTAADEIVRLATEAGDVAMILTGRAWRFTSLLELGDAPGLNLESERISHLEQRLRQPRFLWLSTQWRAMRALLTGRFAEAEELAHSVLSTAPRGQDRAAVHGIEQAFGVQMLILRREQGRLQELEPALKGFIERYPSVPGWRAALAWVLSDLGREAEARDEFEQLATNRFGQIPRDVNWLVSMSLLAETCALLRDARRAATLYELLLPYADRCVVVSFAVASFGSVARYLGMLAAAMSNWEEAAQHFARAIEVDERMGARPWVAHTQREYARMLLVRAQPGDRERSVGLLARSLETAKKLDGKALTEKALALELRADELVAADVRTSIDAVACLVSSKSPDLHWHAGSDGTITILFTDIEGFGAIAQRLGEERAQGVLQAHHAIVRDEVAAHAGVEIECQRDGFALAFATPRGALTCAIAVQCAIVAYNDLHPIEPLRLRIGLHTGAATGDVACVLGTTVMPAARIAAHARGGEILVSSPVRDRWATLHGLSFVKVRAIKLRGESSMRAIYRVDWAAARPAKEALSSAGGHNVFRREGEYWTLAYEGTVCRLKDAKGLHHIALLLGHPGKQFKAEALVAATEPEIIGTPRAESSGEGGFGEDRVSGLGDAGSLLDEKAKEAYKRRLRELRGELTEAEEFNDFGRAEAARAEIEMLTTQLAAAVGLGGRDRKAASSAERARLTVTKRIKDALNKISEGHPALGEYLVSAIKTGHWCTYHPARRVDWVL
jgi:class 3 adenylate cyclase